MSKLTVDEFEAKLSAIQAAEPDKLDLAMISDIEADTDGSAVSLDSYVARRECSGKISLRVPKELHYSLLENAKENGVSLNQFIVYKLAKP